MWISNKQNNNSKNFLLENGKVTFKAKSLRKANKLISIWDMQRLCKTSYNNLKRIFITELKKNYLNINSFILKFNVKYLETDIKLRLRIKNKKMYKCFKKEIIKYLNNRYINKKFKIKKVRLILIKYILEKNNLKGPYAKWLRINTIYNKQARRFNFIRLLRFQLHNYWLQKNAVFNAKKKQILNFRELANSEFKITRPKFLLDKQPSYYSKPWFNRFLRPYRFNLFNDLRDGLSMQSTANNLFTYSISKSSRKKFTKKKVAKLLNVPWWWIGTNKQYRYYNSVIHNSYLINNIRTKKLFKHFSKKFLPYFIKNLNRWERLMRKMDWKQPHPLAIVNSQGRYKLRRPSIRTLDFIDKGIKGFKKLLRENKDLVDLKIKGCSYTPELIYEKIKSLDTIWRNISDTDKGKDNVLAFRRFYWVAKKFNRFVLFMLKTINKTKFKYWYLNFINASHNSFTKSVNFYYNKKLNKVQNKINELIALKQMPHNTYDNKEKATFLKYMSVNTNEILENFDEVDSQYYTMYNLLITKKNQIDSIKKKILVNFKQLHINPMLLKYKTTQSIYFNKRKKARLKLVKATIKNSRLLKATALEFGTTDVPNHVFKALGQKEYDIHLPIFSFLVKPKILKRLIKSWPISDRVAAAFLKNNNWFHMSGKLRKWTEKKRKKLKRPYFNLKFAVKRIRASNLRLLFFSLKFRKFLLSLPKSNKKSLRKKKSYNKAYKKFFKKSKALLELGDKAEFEKNEDWHIRIRDYLMFNIKNPRLEKESFPDKEKIEIIQQLTEEQSYMQDFSKYYFLKVFEKYDPAIYRPKYKKLETYSMLHLYKNWFKLYSKKNKKQVLLKTLIKVFGKNRKKKINFDVDVFLENSRYAEKCAIRFFDRCESRFKKSEFNKKIIKKGYKYKKLVKKYKKLVKKEKKMNKISTKKKLLKLYSKKYKKYMKIKIAFLMLKTRKRRKFKRLIKKIIISHFMPSREYKSEFDTGAESTLSQYNRIIISLSKRKYTFKKSKSRRAYTKWVESSLMNKCIRKYIPEDIFIKMLRILRKKYLRKLSYMGWKKNMYRPLLWYKKFKRWIRTFKHFKWVRKRLTRKFPKNKWGVRQKKNLWWEKKKLKKLVIRSLRPPEPIHSRTTFYDSIDGRYFSYWVGRLIGMFTKRGLKNKSAYHVYKSFLILKYELQLQPQKILIEMLNRLKPLYKLQGFVVRRTQVKTYPRLVRLAKRYLVVLTWLRFDMLKNYDPQTSIETFVARFANRMLELRGLNLMRTSLWQRRDEYNRESVSNLGNLRYMWRKKRQKLRRRY